LANRLRAYFSVPSLKGSDLVINQALLKHGLANFSLEILAYCDLKDLAAKEQYFISKYQSEYNLNLKA
jgi:group I intron endonuclease